MTSAVIVSTARTPLAKSWKGSFNMTHGATLGGHAVEHAIKRAGIDAAEVDAQVSFHHATSIFISRSAWMASAASLPCWTACTVRSWPGATQSPPA